MSLDTASRKKRTTEDGARRTPEDDHRRKRRNRTTQSCLNCHTSKRMCDRKRPCGRCTQLGLTGLCVYEVDDPSQRSDSQDEKSRLQKRVAELESVIRELKNKPHPRWAPMGAGEDSALTQSTVDGCPTLSSPPASPTKQKSSRDGKSPQGFSKLQPGNSSPKLNGPAPQPLRRALSSTSPGTPSPATSSSPAPVPTIDVQLSNFADHSAFGADTDMAALLLNSPDTPSDLADGDLQTLFDCLIPPEAVDGFWPLEACNAGGTHEHCGCLEDPTSYHTILELSLRLRRASDTLNRFAKHGAGAACAINQSITELDRFTSNVLGNINAPSDNFIPSPVRNHSMYSGTSSPTYPPTTYGTAQGSHSMPTTPPNLVGAQLPSPQSWGFKPVAYPSPPYEDSFMSWEPQRY